MGNPTPTGVTEQIREEPSQNPSVKPSDIAATPQIDTTEFESPALEAAAAGFIDSVNAYLQTAPQNETAWLTQEIYQTFGVTENNPDALGELATRMEALSEAVQSSNTPNEIKAAASNLFTLSAESPADLLKLAAFVANGGAVSGVIQANGRNSENDEIIRSRDAYRNAMSLAAMESARIVQAAVNDFKNNLLPNLYDKTPEETARLYREFLRGQTANLTPEESSDITVNTMGAAAQDPNLTPSQLEAMRQVAIEELTATYGGDLERARTEVNNAIQIGLARRGSEVELASRLENAIQTGNLKSFVDNASLNFASAADEIASTETEVSSRLTDGISAIYSATKSLLASFAEAAAQTDNNDLDQSLQSLQAEEFENQILTMRDSTINSITQQIALINDLKSYKERLELDASNPVWGELIRQDIAKIEEQISDAEIRLSQNVALLEQGLLDANTWYQRELDASLTNEDGIMPTHDPNNPAYSPGQYVHLASISVREANALLSQIDTALGRELSPEELVIRSVRGRSSISEYEIGKILEATGLEGEELEAEIAKAASFIEENSNIEIIRNEQQKPAPQTPEINIDAIILQAEMRVWNDIRNEGLSSISKEDLISRLSEAGISGEQLIISTEQVIADLQDELGVNFITGLDYPEHIDVPGLVGHDPERTPEPEPMLLSQNDPEITQQQQPLAPPMV